ncbi:response regulator [Bacillus sp. PS06]|uniref:response regulator n=1 Tax=Bacillus sp. PS06 TaxID=2764176 RepID=UPI0017805E28|nr:response regulator transcription factor [Bacillus sp. PS06]MBD8068685.1 response regulator transcription factor [Bacillus sp. PS06]
MYKVLLVDDERIILEGISQIIKWEDLGTKLIGKARNGIEGCEFIRREQPDIVICDIKMPGMNGLELVEMMSKEFPSIKFIILSGFNDFNYAKQAMAFGVQHYLLKPCNEKSIADALSKVIEDLNRDAKRAEFLIETKSRLDQVQPLVKKQLLKEFISSKQENNRGIYFYEKLLRMNFQEEYIRLIMFRIEGEFHYEHMFVIENLGEDLFSKSILSTSIGDNVLFLVNEQEFNHLQLKIEQLRDHFYEIYRMDMTVAISEYDCIARVRNLYLEALECLNHRFYLGEGSIITKNDIHKDQYMVNNYEYDGQSLSMFIKSGNLEKVEAEITCFFHDLTERRFPINVVRAHVMQVFLAIIQNSDSIKIQSYIDKMSKLIEMDTIQQMEEFFLSAAKEITQVHYDRHKSNHSVIIQKIIDLVEQNVANTDLSLKWVANKVYMNADYLGKLFKQEMGQKFSSYVTQMRVNKAIEQIHQMEEVKVFEIAEMIGFGDNPQYFSQVFKKLTGYSPTDYKKAN